MSDRGFSQARIRPGIPPVTIGFIICFVLAYLGRNLTDPSSFILVPTKWFSEFWRAFTTAFTFPYRVSLLSLIIQILVFFVVGRFVETLMGSLRYAALLVFSIPMTSAIQTIVVLALPFTIWPPFIGMGLLCQTFAALGAYALFSLRDPTMLKSRASIFILIAIIAAPIAIFSPAMLPGTIGALVSGLIGCAILHHDDNAAKRFAFLLGIFAVANVVIASLVLW